MGGSGRHTAGGDGRLQFLQFGFQILVRHDQRLDGRTQIAVAHRDGLIAGLLVAVVVGQGRSDGHGGTPEAGGRKACSLFVLKKSSRTWQPENGFFFLGAREDLREAEGCVDVGENDLPEGRRFWRTEFAERAKRNDQAMMSGVIWSSMKAMRSRNCNLRFFSRCSRSKSGAGD